MTDPQVKCFHENGFFILRDAFSREDISLLSDWSDEMLSRPEETGKHWVYHEISRKDHNVDLVGRIENIAPFHTGFESLTQALARPVGQLLGEEAALFKEKINFKMPGGDGFKAHQDSQAGWGIYADFFISALVSIDAATIKNGCLELSAGHHHQGVFRTWEPLKEKDMKGMDFHAYPTEPGDIIFFDCFTPHKSEPNLSDSIRRIYYATYNRLSTGQHMAQYYSDKHANFPPDIDRNPNKTYVFKV